MLGEMLWSKRLGLWQPSTASSEATAYSRLEKVPHFLLAPFSEETFALRRGRKTKTRTKSEPRLALPGVRAERRFVERKEHFAFEAPLGPVVELQDRLSKGWKWKMPIDVYGKVIEEAWKTRKRTRRRPEIRMSFVRFATL